MGYFSWILGVLLACALGVVNLLWLESTRALGECEEEDRDEGETL